MLPQNKLSDKPRTCHRLLLLSVTTRLTRLLSESYVADFDGRSSLLYRFNQKSMSTLKDVISLRFKSHQAEGVLLHGEGQRGDYITLELHRGRLDLYLNLGASSDSFPFLLHVLPSQKLKNRLVPLGVQRLVTGVVPSTVQFVYPW